MPPISAILITFNEERDLPLALSSLAGVADEIVIVDSGSTDGTAEIGRRCGARVLSRPFTNFAEQKNFAASAASHDWVFSLDADEVVSPELRASLLAWKAGPPAGTAYQVSRKTNYLGQWILHSGWYPEYHVRLYRRDAQHFVGAIHESVQPRDDSRPEGAPDSALRARPRAKTSAGDGRAERPPGRLRGDLWHYSIRTLAEHYAKQDAFTTRAAEELHAQGCQHWRMSMWLASPWVLLQKFVLQAGFLDGYRGALIAWTSARYVWMKYRKLGILARGGKLPGRPWPQAGDA